MLKKICLLILLFAWGDSHANQHAYQTSPPLGEISKISININKNSDESITLSASNGITKSIIDTYLVGDGNPEVKYYFVYPINNVCNIITLVSWDETDIRAIHYKIYAYIYNGNGEFYVNKKIISNKTLEGYDSYSGGGMTFDYKKPEAIKKYFDEH